MGCLVNMACLACACHSCTPPAYRDAHGPRRGLTQACLAGHGRFPGGLSSPPYESRVDSREMHVPGELAMRRTRHTIFMSDLTGTTQRHVSPLIIAHLAPWHPRPARRRSCAGAAGWQRRCLGLVAAAPGTHPDLEDSVAGCTVEGMQDGRWSHLEKSPHCQQARRASSIVTIACSCARHAPAPWRSAG